MKLIIDEHDVTLSNMNLRREKHGDSKVMAVDLNVSLEVSPDVLNQLISASSEDENFEHLLYDEDGNRKASGMGLINFTTEFQKHRIKLNHSIDDNFAKVFEGVKLCKFKADPQAGHIVDMSFQIQIQPSKEQVHWLTDGYEKEIWTLEVLGPNQKDMFDDQNSASMESEEETEEEETTEV